MPIPLDMLITHNVINSNLINSLMLPSGYRITDLSQFVDLC
jgi:hypothetical protein